MRTDTDTEYLNSKQVQARYGGVSHMWIFRAIRDHSFPPCVRFGNGRLKFWPVSAIVAWERRAIVTKTTGKPARKRAA